MRLKVKAGAVAELEVRDWRVARAEGDLAGPYRRLVEILIDEVVHLPETRRRVVLRSQFERLGLEIVEEEWPPFGEAPPGTIP